MQTSQQSVRTPNKSRTEHGCSNEEKAETRQTMEHDPLILLLEQANSSSAVSDTAKLQAELASAICREMCKPRTPARRLSISVAREVATNLAEQADIRENLERAVIEGHLDAAGLEALQQAEKHAPLADLAAAARELQVLKQRSTPDPKTTYLAARGVVLCPQK